MTEMPFVPGKIYVWSWPWQSSSTFICPGDRVGINDVILILSCEYFDYSGEVYYKFMALNCTTGKLFLNARGRAGVASQSIATNAIRCIV